MNITYIQKYSFIKNFASHNVMRRHHDYLYCLHCSNEIPNYANVKGHKYTNSYYLYLYSGLLSPLLISLISKVLIFLFYVQLLCLPLYNSSNYMQNYISCLLIFLLFCFLYYSVYSYIPSFFNLSPYTSCNYIQSFSYFLFILLMIICRASVPTTLYFFHYMQIIYFLSTPY